MLKVLSAALISIQLLASSVYALEDDKATPPPSGKRIRTDIPAGGAQEVLKQQTRKSTGAIPPKGKVTATGACRDSSGRTFQPTDPGYDLCTTHSNQNENQVQIQTKVKEW